MGNRTLRVLALASGMLLFTAALSPQADSHDKLTNSTDALKALQGDWSKSLRDVLSARTDLDSLERLVLHPRGTNSQKLTGSKAIKYAQETINGFSPYWRQRLIILGSVAVLKANSQYWLVTTSAQANDGWLLAFIDVSDGLVTLVVKIPEG